jgi:hypothetical protein
MRRENGDGTLRLVTVACVLFDGDEGVPDYSRGIFTEEWVDRLYRGVARNTTRRFRMVCYTDRPRSFSEDVIQRPIKLGYRNCLSLLEPFADDLGRVVFMGLDTIIVGNIDRLMDYDGPFAMLQDPWAPRSCSGVMAYPYTPEIWQAFEAAHELHAATALLGEHPSDMVYLATQPHVLLDDCGIYSYKAHCRGGVPADARIVYFHGREKPHELSHDWIAQHWGPPL